MALILDTNAFSAFVDGDLALRRVIQSETNLEIPVMVLGEYLYGIQHSRFTQRYQAWLNLHLSAFVFLSVRKDTAQYYADIRSELRSQGHPIPSNDIWIAALSRQYGHAVVTRDSHFSAVRGLKRIDW